MEFLLKVQIIHIRNSQTADSMNALYDLISTGRPRVLSHCSATDWNLNFIHRLVYIRPVMYSNRTVRRTSLLYVSAYLTQTCTTVAMFPIILPISIEITELKRVWKAEIRWFHSGIFPPSSLPRGKCWRRYWPNRQQFIREMDNYIVKLWLTY